MSTASAFLYSQENQAVFESRYFIFYAESRFDVPPVFFENCDRQIEFYNNFLRFKENAADEGRMIVRIFDSEEKLADYSGKLGLGKPDKSVILYTVLLSAAEQKIEAAAVKNALQSSEFRRTLFYQYLRSRIPHPPAWYESALALYLEMEQKRFFQPEVNNNVNPLKAVLFSNLSAEKADEIVSVMTGEKAFDSRTDTAAAWVIIEFMLDSRSDPAYSRLLWDSLSVPEAGLSSEENLEKISAYFKKWIDLPLFKERIKEYLKNSETLESLYKRGRNLYEKGSLSEAENIFRAILNEDPANHYSLYFTGLIRYSEKRYEEALDYYRRSLEAGGDEALLSYATGLAHYSGGSKEQAVQYLEKAKALSPLKYAALSDHVLDILSAYP